MTRIGGALVVLLLISAVPAPAYAQAVAAAPAPQLTVEQMKDFLKTAKVIRSRQTSQGRDRAEAADAQRRHASRTTRCSSPSTSVRRWRT